ncbi:MAG: HNH endonuclease, partial [Balneolaceae bacterium]
KYNNSGEVNPSIGCTILTEPFFFPRDQWIPVPESWKPNIVQGKTYDTNQSEGYHLWNSVEERLGDLSQREGELVWQEPAVGYGKPVLIKSRLGQGAFRVNVTEAYQRRCAVTGEKTLPVLEAAHIRPFSEEGPNLTRNGLLLRSDMHILFDKGYLTVGDDLRLEVSRRIREEFENGREYYHWHGKELSSLPQNIAERPDSMYMEYHREHIYKG